MTFKDLLLTSFYKIWWLGDASFNAPYWMMKTLFFGTFFTFIITLGTCTKKKYALFMFLALSLIYISEDGYNVCFVLGALIAYLRHCMKVWDLYAGKKCTWLSTVLLITGVYMPTCWKIISSKGISNMGIFGKGAFYNILGSFCVLFAFMGLGSVKKVIAENSILKFVGKISFAIYLVHWPIICSLSCWLYMRLCNVIIDRHRLISIIFIMTTIVTCIGAALFHEMIEKKICGKLVSWICNTYFE